MAPTLITSYFVQQNTTASSALTTPSFTPSNGEVIVVKLATWDTGVSMGAGLAPASGVQGLKALVKVPVIASLNGCRPGGWTDYAVKMERAGADAIELNLYQLITDPRQSGDEIEADMLQIKAYYSQYKGKNWQQFSTD